MRLPNILADASLALTGWEIVLILTVILVLFATRRLPKIARELGEGFRSSTDQAAHDAGESLGGIYGEPAAEALTPDNQTAELYDPTVFHRDERPGRAPKRIRWCLRLWRSLWDSVLKRVKRFERQ